MSRSAWLVIAAIALVVVGVRAWVGFQNRERAVEAAPLARVTVPQLVGVAGEGEKLFNARCARCHGENAAGRDGIAPPLVHPVYEPNHHGDSSFYNAAMNGVRQHHWPFGSMPPVEGIRKHEIDKIVAYVRTLQKANGIF